MSILVIAEHDNSLIKGATLNTVAAASRLNAEVTLLVAGCDISGVLDEAKKILGVSKIISCDDELYKNFLAEDFSKLVLSIADSYSYIFAPATTFGKNLMPRISAKLDTQQISDIISVESEDTFKRPIYAGSCIATVKSNDSVKLITVRATAFDPVTLDNNDVPVESIGAVDASKISEFVSEEIAKSDRPELTAANIVISGGRGMQSGDNFHLLDSIADKLGADLYIAVGISGAIQHLAGMKDSKVIVAINKDEDAPIFQVADYGLVADLFTALPELDSKL